MKPKHFTLIMLAIVLRSDLFAAQSAQEEPNNRALYQARLELEQKFINKFGARWQISWHEKQNSIEQLNGSYATGEFISNEDQASKIANQFISNIEDMIGIKSDQFREISSNFNSYLKRYKVIFVQDTTVTVPGTQFF